MEISDVQAAALSSRMEVWMEAVKANVPCAFSHSFGLNMCIRRLFQSSHLQWARRAAFPKHSQCGHQGPWRWTHSGGGPYRAVIFDMGGVLIPSPGKVAAGELFGDWGGGGIGVGSGGWRVVRRDREEHLVSSVSRWVIFWLLNQILSTT